MTLNTDDKTFLREEFAKVRKAMANAGVSREFPMQAVPPQPPMGPDPDEAARVEDALLDLDIEEVRRIVALAMAFLRKETGEPMACLAISLMQDAEQLEEDLD